jgi:hypothetical protein
MGGTRCCASARPNADHTAREWQPLPHPLTRAGDPAAAARRALITARPDSAAPPRPRIRGCQQTSNEPEHGQRAQGQHVPMYYLCVLGVLCGYDNNSVSACPSNLTPTAPHRTMHAQHGAAPGDQTGIRRPVRRRLAGREAGIVRSLAAARHIAPFPASRPSAGAPPPAAAPSAALRNAPFLRLSAAPLAPGKGSASRHPAKRLVRRKAGTISMPVEPDPTRPGMPARRWSRRGGWQRNTVQPGAP